MARSRAFSRYNSELVGSYTLFSTGGDWDSTSLFRDGQEFMAAQLFVSLQTPRDYDGQPIRGGLRNGGEMTAYATPQDTSGDVAIFPGKIDLEFPTHKLTIENQTPNFAIEFTQVFLDERDITAEVIEIQINIDANSNQVEGFIVLYKPHFFGADEVATYTLI